MPETPKHSADKLSPEMVQFAISTEYPIHPVVHVLKSDFPLINLQLKDWNEKRFVLAGLVDNARPFQLSATDLIHVWHHALPVLSDRFERYDLGTITSLAHASQGHPYLEKLSISKNYMVDHKYLERILMDQESLKHLENGYSQVSDELRKIHSFKRDYKVTSPVLREVTENMGNGVDQVVMSLMIILSKRRKR